MFRSARKHLNRLRNFHIEFFNLDCAQDATTWPEDHEEDDHDAQEDEGLGQGRSFLYY